jgi:Zn-dependent protease
MGALLEIPQFAGTIIIPSTVIDFHIGKQEIRESISIPLKDDKVFDPISSVRKDARGDIIKQHFIIHKTNQFYTIEDLGSTNGTYIRNINIKGLGPKPLNDGTEIVIPIQENNQLIQMKLIFRIVADKALPSTEQAVYADPKAMVSKGIPKYSTPSSPSSSTSGSNSSGSQPAYNLPIQTPIYTDPQSASVSQIGLDKNQSFIVHSQKGATIPSNAFSPNSGVDLSFVYKLEKSETWHIFMALLLLTAMIIRVAINILAFQLILQEITWADLPLRLLLLAPIILIFPLSFLLHELSHLNMGRHFKYQSRFCLTNVGFRSTIIATILGLPFGLPGAAVSIGLDPTQDRKAMGFIKMAGPLSNLILGAILIGVSVLVPIQSETLYFIKLGIIQAATLNLVLGIFNMIPIAVRGFALDGEYIVKWNKLLYFALVLLMIGCFVGVFFLIKIYDAQYYEYLQAL